MDEKELLKERFKSAVSSAVKAISGNYDLEIKFGNNSSTKKNFLSLPEIANLKKLQDFENNFKTKTTFLWHPPNLFRRLKLSMRKLGCMSFEVMSTRARPIQD